MNLTLMDRWRYVLAMFLNQELFWMSNKTLIIEFGFRIVWRIMKISEGVIRRGRDTCLDLHNSNTQPHSLIIVNH